MKRKKNKWIPIKEYSELTMTNEALRRSRNLRKSMESVINSPGFPPIEERARRLMCMVEHCHNPNQQFEDEEDKEYWMEEYIKLITN